MKKITIIGGGPGDEGYILPAARKILGKSDKIAGDRRMLESFGLDAETENVHPMDSIMETLEWMKFQGENVSIAVLVSGDPLVYSMYRLIRRTFCEVDTEIVPGIGSIQFFAARLGETLEESRILSGHGRNLSREIFLSNVRKYPKVFILCDSEHSPAWFARQLLKSGLKDVKMAVGSRMSYEDEYIEVGSPEKFSRIPYSDLSLVMIKNVSSSDTVPIPLRDEAFFRNRTPMTREEVRWIILGKLALRPEALLWDIGAGTGSVSIEAARYLREGRVIAVEKNPRALEVLYKNKETFALTNMEIVEGSAIEKINTLERPTHVFIGGAGKEMDTVLKYIENMGGGIKVLIACVTLETLNRAYSLCTSLSGLNFPELVTIRIEQSRPLGGYHLMEGGHPVTLIITETKGHPSV